ncbi:MAG: hypothetical protein GXP30_11050, partial [Verrucomicrobia bacterium]|nr:hypothetical protein [Verrucomicrobiota bacterium]
MNDVSAVVERYFSEDRMTVVSLDPLGKGPSINFGESAGAESEVRKTILENGLTLLVKRDARVPVVNLSAVFRGGVLAETESDNGVNSLMSRLLTS